jgi:ribokinase
MKSRELKFLQSDLKYKGIIGTGGIGSGKFFVMNGEHTLGREESRSGHFLDIRDYCKQHIIMHYVKILLGECFEVIPVGKIGDDDVGMTLSAEMRETGFDIKRIEEVPKTSTLFSFCFYYPDGSGGNLTTDNSASSMVDMEFIETAEPDIKRLGQAGIIMAAPEVPLAARKKLLELGKHHGLFCTASFTTGEMGEVINSEIPGLTDFIAINIDEASAAAGVEGGKMDPLSVVRMAIQSLTMKNNSMRISVTGGKDGSWCWDGSDLNWFPAIKVDPVSTAGAGDAFFAGIISGLALGLHIFDAQQLASLVAGLSVCSPDTIHKGIDRSSLRQFMLSSKMNFSETIINLLEE